MGTELTKAEVSFEWLESLMRELLDLGGAGEGASNRLEGRASRVKLTVEMRAENAIRQ